MKDVQATREAISPQKKTSSSNTKHEISSLSLFLCAIFALLDPDPADKNQCGSGSTTLEISNIV
jgi:hypothetical protein